MRFHRSGAHDPAVGICHDPGPERLSGTRERQACLRQERLDRSEVRRYGGNDVHPL